ncbi:MAG: hypothetical protein R3284_07875 [Rubricoccaceae bacterium]|nr:hypothetical protein [Rubricoccaceae bacterium]
MKNLTTTPDQRRGFLKQFAAGTVALAAGGLATAPARAMAGSQRRSTQPSDDWLDRIHGSHRQVFDLVEVNSGLGAAYTMNYLTSFKAAHSDVSDDELCAVAVFRHNAFPLILNDAMWAKYKLGEFFGVTDPETNAPAERNIFRNNIPLQPGLTYEDMIAEKGVVIVACSVAWDVYSMLTAPNAGVTHEEAKAEWAQNVLDGVELVASGVYAVNRAQEHGCSYCYAG